MQKGNCRAEPGYGNSSFVFLVLEISGRIAGIVFEKYSFPSSHPHGPFFRKVNGGVAQVQTPHRCPRQLWGNTQQHSCSPGEEAITNRAGPPQFFFRARRSTRKNRNIPCPTPLFTSDENTPVSCGNDDGDLGDFLPQEPEGGRAGADMNATQELRLKKSGKKERRPYPSSNVVTPNISSSGSGTGSILV